MIFILAVSVALLAYIIVPGLGGFRARTRWRRFRERVMRSSLHTQVKFEEGVADGPLGAHRFVGRIEALQDDDSLWVRGEGVSVQAVVADAEIYLLPTEGELRSVARTLLEERLPDDNPRRMSWKRMTSLQEGTRVYLAGFLERQDDVLRMYGSKDVPLLVLLHEGEDVVPRAIWSGRQRNEYWNALTPWALLAGSLGLFIMASAAFRSDQASWTARILLTAALSPVISFVPPGVVFFLIYLSNWRRARFLRAERDLLGLCAYLRAGDAQDQTLGWGDDIPQDTVSLIQSCRRRAVTTEFLAFTAFLTGFVINAFLVAVAINFVT